MDTLTHNNQKYVNLTEVCLQQNIKPNTAYIRIRRNRPDVLYTKYKQTWILESGVGLITS